MGHYVSKLFLSEPKVSNVKTEMKDIQTQTSDSEEPRTPIMFRKLHSNSDCIWDDERSPLKTKVLKNLIIDPRSPTAGIYRTPIYIEDAKSGNVKSRSFDSPISIYSSNISGSVISSSDVMTPNEPSINVSGFEDNEEVENELVLALENIKNTKAPEKKIPLKVIDKPKTYEAKKLLEEINLGNENFLKKDKTFVRKEIKAGLTAINDKSCNEFNVNSLKSRTPLSNITSSTNSPSSMIQSGKMWSRSKALADFGSENSLSPAIQQRAQWDKNNTVII